MTDYSKYSYRKLLEFFELEDRYNKKGVDSVGYLLSMSNAKSIDELIAIYNNVLKKIAYYVYCRQESDTWFMTESWGEKSYLAIELNDCFNENIDRWYKSIENPSKEDCILCVVNLRESNNKSKIQSNITSYHYLEDLHDLALILADREDVYTIIKQIRSINHYSLDSYPKLKEEYIAVMEKLLSYGYKKTVIEDKFEELRGIDIDKEIEHKKEIEALEFKQRKSDKAWNFFFFACCLSVIAFIIWLVSDIGVNFLGIIVIIGLLGAIPKLFLTGKF